MVAFANFSREASNDENISRRALLATAAALGATAAFAKIPVESRSGWREARRFFPEGVASGDPDSTSVILWTRRPYAAGRRTPRLIVEVAEDRAFEHVVATTKAMRPKNPIGPRVFSLAG